jgi:uncharacterized membrane protein
MTTTARRASLVLLAVLGLAVAGSLAAFQVGLVRLVWDPIFGSTSSERVLTSAVSRATPVPDAVLGSAAYAAEVALGLIVLATGRRAAVVGLAILAGLGASASVVLVALQPIVAGAWCSLCLLSAAISIGLAVGAISEARNPPSPSRSRGRQEVFQP